MSYFFPFILYLIYITVTTRWSRVKVIKSRSWNQNVFPVSVVKFVKFWTALVLRRSHVRRRSRVFRLRCISILRHLQAARELPYSTSPPFPWPDPTRPDPDLSHSCPRVSPGLDACSNRGKGKRRNRGKCCWDTAQFRVDPWIIPTVEVTLDTWDLGRRVIAGRILYLNLQVYFFFFIIFSLFFLMIRNFVGFLHNPGSARKRTALHTHGKNDPNSCSRVIFYVCAQKCFHLLSQPLKCQSVPFYVSLIFLSFF